MKWVKSDARSVRIKNWVCKNMVNIYSHGSNHDKIGFTPMIFKKHFRNEKRENKMQKIMEDFPNVKYFTHSKILFFSDHQFNWCKITIKFCLSKNPVLNLHPFFRSHSVALFLALYDNLFSGN